MRQSALLQRIIPATFVFVLLLSPWPRSAAQNQPNNGETIVLIRHGEKPSGGLGQLTCKGLNRALALPNVLISRFGKPDYIYAPDPAMQVDESVVSFYSYVRPLATIEPTAIRLGMPVNTQIGYREIDKLQRALFQPNYAHAVVYVAWEHLKLHDFAKQILQTYGNGAGSLPDWPNSDYDTIYVFHVTRSGTLSSPKAVLEIQHEGLDNSLSDTCPGQP